MPVVPFQIKNMNVSPHSHEKKKWTLDEICDFQFSFFICITTHSHFLWQIKNILMEKKPPVDSVIDSLRAFFLPKVLFSA